MFAAFAGLTVSVDGLLPLAGLVADQPVSADDRAGNTLADTLVS